MIIGWSGAPGAGDAGAFVADAKSRPDVSPSSFVVPALGAELPTDDSTGPAAPPLHAAITAITEPTIRSRSPRRFIRTTSPAVPSTAQDRASHVGTLHRQG